MPEDIEHRIPLGLCKQAAMKLDAFITDIHEIKEDEDLTQEDKQTFEQIAEVSGTMLAIIVNMVRKEMGEDEFLAEDVVMDENNNSMEKKEQEGTDYGNVCKKVNTGS